MYVVHCLHNKYGMLCSECEVFWSAGLQKGRFGIKSGLAQKGMTCRSQMAMAVRDLNANPGRSMATIQSAPGSSIINGHPPLIVAYFESHTITKFIAYSGRVIGRRHNPPCNDEHWQLEHGPTWQSFGCQFDGGRGGSQNRCFAATHTLHCC